MSLIHEVADIFHNQKFPRNWKTIELNKVLKIQNGFAFKSSNFNSDKIGMPLIRIRDIKNSSMETFYSGTILEDFIVTQGDLLIGMDGDFNSNLWNGNPALLNQRVCRLIPDENFILKKLLYYGLPNYLNKINENTSSTTVKHLSSKSIGEIPFPLPPLAEQNRIVAKLDTLFAQLETIKTSMEKIPVLLKDFRQQVIDKEFSQDWQKSELKDLCFKIQDGAHHSPKITYESQVQNTYPYITSKNIRNNYMKLDNVRYVDHIFHNSIYPRCTPEIGDVLLTKDGVNTGNVTLNELNEPFSLLSSVCLIKTNEEKILPGFLKYYFQSNIGFNELIGEMTGTAIKRIVLKKIKATQVPTPPTKKQKEIVNIIESLFAKADAIEKQYETLKQKIETLPQAILHKAFKGELTEQLDTDGDARELLKQIQELKASTSKVKKGGKVE